VDEEIQAHYGAGVELERLTQGYSRLEFARTKELLGRYLPLPPAVVLDVGGGPGLYAEWLAEEGYQVRLVDPVELHIEEARKRAGGRFAVAQGDARRLDDEDSSCDVVLLLGPLYHLIERHDRLGALAEAHRVLRPGGLLAAAAISRFASLLDGLRGGFLSDPVFRGIVERDLEEGQHRNPGRLGYFTTAFFHRPEELRAEVEATGFEGVQVFGVEGPGWLLPEAGEDGELRENALYAARAVEREPTVVGASAHMLAVARKV
jgi:SAM-dependent methyltransferase